MEAHSRKQEVTYYLNLPTLSKSYSVLEKLLQNWIHGSFDALTIFCLHQEAHVIKSSRILLIRLAEYCQTVTFHLFFQY